MGAGSSAQSVQEHLDKQEACIKKLQEVLKSQKSGGGGFVFEEGDPEDGASAGSDYEDETEVPRLAMRMAAKQTPVADDGTDEQGEDFVWREPTEEERQDLSLSKPWLLSMVPPTDWKFSDPDRDLAPPVNLKLQYVYGYRTRCVRNTLFWVDDKRAVYFAASIGIVHDFSTNTQSFFQGHTDDIIAIAYHPATKMVATAQLGKAPVICVWDVETKVEKAKLGGFHKRGVVSLSFSADGSLLTSIGLDDTYSIAVYAWESGQKTSSDGCSKLTLDSMWLPQSNSCFLTSGVKCLFFWEMKDGGLVKTSANLGKKGRNQAFLSIGHSNDGEMLVGTAGGEIYVLGSQSKQLASIIYAHNGPVTSLALTSMGVVSGGQDGYVCLWDDAFVKTWCLSLADGCARNSVRSLHASGDKLLVGCVNASISKIDLKAKTKEPLVAFHSGDINAKQRYGELWAVCEDPSGPRFATVCDDAVLKIWNSDTHNCECSIGIGSERAGGPARSLSWSPDGNYLAAGFLQGSVALFNVTDGFSEQYRVRNRKRRVQTTKFSPCSKLLAVGGADNVVDIYCVDDGFKRIAECKGNTGVILSIDWSSDSKYIQTSSQDYVLTCYSVPEAEVVSPEASKDVVWATQTSFMGWSVQGIWPKDSDGSDINSLAKSHNGSLLATADEHGQVKVFRHPCIGSGLDMKGELKRRPKSTTGTGQSSVTNVAWHCKDNVLWTSGGEDLTVFQWGLE